MSTKLSLPIEAYLQATNARDTDALLDTFTADALVTDEGRTYRGHEEIKEWSQRTLREYQPTLDVMESTQTQEETIITALVAGTFEGSPIPLRFHFTLSGDKITSLTIGG